MNHQASSTPHPALWCIFNCFQFILHGQLSLSGSTLPCTYILASGLALILSYYFCFFSNNSNIWKSCRSDATVWGFCWFSHMTPYFVFYNFWTEFIILETLPLGILWGLCFRWVYPESIFIFFCRVPGGFTSSGCFKSLARNFSDSLCSKNSVCKCT